MKFQICTLPKNTIEHNRTEHGDAAGHRGLETGQSQGHLQVRCTRPRCPRLRRRLVRQLEHATPVASYEDAMALARGDSRVNNFSLLGTSPSSPRRTRAVKPRVVSDIDCWCHSCIISSAFPSSGDTRLSCDRASIRKLQHYWTRRHALLQAMVVCTRSTLGRNMPAIYSNPDIHQ